MEKKLSKFSNYLIGILLGLLGFSTSCDKQNNEPVLMYGTPHAKHQISGKITSETNEAISGISVKVYPDIVDPLIDPLNPLLHVKAVFTDATGAYSQSYDIGWPEQKYKVCVEDVDGDKNGLYENKIELVEIKKTDLSGGDKNWYYGSASKVLNVQLKKK